MQTQLNIRLSLDEKLRLEQRAAAAGLSVSEFVRLAVLGPGETACDDAVPDPAR